MTKVQTHPNTQAVALKIMARTHTQTLEEELPRGNWNGRGRWLWHDAAAAEQQSRNTLLLASQLLGCYLLWMLMSRPFGYGYELFVVSYPYQIEEQQQKSNHVNLLPQAVVLRQPQTLKKFSLRGQLLKPLACNVATSNQSNPIEFNESLSACSISWLLLLLLLLWV